MKTTTVKILLNDFSKIKKFNNEICKFESDVDLVKGRYVVDAKSTMGIFTLDLSVPIDVVLHGEEESEKFIEVMKEFE